MTDQQIENWSIGIKSAVAMGLFLVTQAIVATMFIMSLKGEIAILNKSVSDIIATQAEIRTRADNRQQEIEAGLAAVESRVRPLETQAASTGATLTSINQSLLNLSAEFRDLRRDLADDDKPAATLRR